MDKILLGHGTGGRLTQRLIDELFLKKFDNDILNQLGDSAVFNINKEKLAFTTDSYVVNPIFFPGGDIGSLAVYGTVNDLAVCGAVCLFISCALIIEEGLDYRILERITDSMRDAAKKAGVKIVTGDTKVVEKGACDKLFINTSGIGCIKRGIDLGTKRIRPGDKVIISGDIGDHGITILIKRRELGFKHRIKSDCGPVNKIISQVLNSGIDVKFMRDPTRGGVAATLNEVVRNNRFGIIIDEKCLPINPAVRAASELLGLDPLYVGNEGKVIIFVPERSSEKALSIIKSNKSCKKASIIGEVVDKYKGEVCLKTKIGGLRLIDMPSAEQLPRIC